MKILLVIAALVAAEEYFAIVNESSTTVRVIVASSTTINSPSFARQVLKPGQSFAPARTLVGKGYAYDRTQDKFTAPALTETVKADAGTLGTGISE